MYAQVKCGIILVAVMAASGFNLGQGDVVFHLFTRNNPTQSQPLQDNIPSIMMSDINFGRPTVFTIHNHGEGVAGNHNAFVVPAHLTADDVNVVAVDWSPGSNMYSIGLANAPQAGRRIANFINILRNSFSYRGLITIVGVGLGGHIAGIAARHSENEIPHVVALDPSFHGWTHHSERLSPDDADVVEVLHTTAGIIGYDYPLGDIDFYPNGGSYQAGCGTDSSCAHIYSYVFYAESILAEVNDRPNFVGTACSSYEEAVALQCEGDRDVVFGGLQSKSGASGIYSFRTNFAQPFAQG